MSVHCCTHHTWFCLLGKTQGTWVEVCLWISWQRQWLSWLPRSRIWRNLQNDHMENILTEMGREIRITICPETNYALWGACTFSTKTFSSPRNLMILLTTWGILHWLQRALTVFWRSSLKAHNASSLTIIWVYKYSQQALLYGDNLIFWNKIYLGKFSTPPIPHPANTCPINVTKSYIICLYTMSWDAYLIH